MKRIVIVVLAFALLMTLLAVTPVMAESQKKIPVTFVRSSPFVVKGDYWYTEGDTFHSRNWELGFNSYSITGDGVSLAGRTSSTIVGNVNLKTHEGNQIYQSEIVFKEGTFDGTIIVKGTFNVVPDTYPVPNLRGYMVPVDTVFRAIWHGTGDYRGWTLTLEYETTGGIVPSPLTGYLLIP